MKKVKDFSGHSGAVYCLAYGKSGSVFTGSGDGMIAAWNIDSLSPEKFAVKIGKAIYSLCHLEQEHLLIVGLSDGSFHVIDLKEKKEIHHVVFHKSSVYSIIYSKKQKLVLISSGDGTVSAWDLQFILKIHLPFTQEKIRALCLSKDESKLFVGCNDGYLRVIETNYFNLVDEVKINEAGVSSIAINPENNMILTGGKDAHLNIYNQDSFKLIKSIPAHNYAIYQIRFNPVENIVATASRDKTIKLWDADSFELLERVGGHRISHKASVNDILWNKDGDKLISVSDDRHISVWEA